MSHPSIALSKLFCGRNTGSTLLVGRDDELVALDAAWSGRGSNTSNARQAVSNKKNIITILAWGGMGKTSLVAHWAAAKLAQPDHSGIERYFDWSFYMQGAPREGDDTTRLNIASADLFIKEALEFFGDHNLAASNAGAWQKGERLAQLITEHRTLLILDGLEPLQDAKIGELRDDGLRALLRGLTARNPGLCIITTRQHLPELAIWNQITSPEWELERLSEQAGAVLLTKLGVDGAEKEKRNLSARVKGHALTLTLLGRYLKHAHHGDIRRVDRVDFRKVSEKGKGGHAFRVMEAYERWFEEDNCRAELAILRVLGLFDRPATPDCLAALRDPPIAGLTDALASLNQDDWNEAVTHLVELDLVEEQSWEPRRIVGYEWPAAAMQLFLGRRRYCRGWRRWIMSIVVVFLKLRGAPVQLGEPKRFEVRRSISSIRYALDAHPLIREFFAKRLSESSAKSWRAGHQRLYDHLQASVPYWPEGLDGLQPLYQAVGHGCQAGSYNDACLTVYIERINRGLVPPYGFYSTSILGAMGADLSALQCFFVVPWAQPAPELTKFVQKLLLNQVAYRLRAIGRLTEARAPMNAGLDLLIEQENWQEAATGAGNLSRLDIASGNLDAAVPEAEQSLTFAKRSGVDLKPVDALIFLGDALHKAGRAKEALLIFEEAEALQRACQPHYPLLYGLGSLHFCDLLLADAERTAWRTILRLHSKKSHRSTAAAACRAVEQRAAQTQELEFLTIRVPTIDVAAHHLILGRAALYRTMVESSAAKGGHVPQSIEIQLKTTLPSELENINAGVDGVRQSGEISELALPLLSRAWLLAVHGQPDLARADLDEVQPIVERGPMRLFMADLHLYRARLFHGVKAYPWTSAKKDLAAARKLIEECGYWRRKEELEDAEEAAKNW